MSDFESVATKAIADLETYLYEPGGAFEKLNSTLTEEGSDLRGLSQVLRTVASGAVRLCGHIEGGIVADLGNNEAAIINGIWKQRGLIPSQGPISTMHQIHIHRPARPLILCPMKELDVAGKQLNVPVAPLERLEFSESYKALIHEALRRLGLEP